MSCATKGELTTFLYEVQGLYTNFLQPGGITSGELQTTVQALVDALSPKEYNGGNYSGKVVIICPTPSTSIVVLNLLYNACLPGTEPQVASNKACYSVALALVPNPNVKQALPLAYCSEIIYDDARVTADSTICQGVNVYDKCDNSCSDDIVTNTLVICGGGVDNCGPKDCLDFLSFLGDKYGFSFAVRRDRKGRLWLVTGEWTDENFPYDHKECGPINDVETCLYFINYEKLRRYYERKSCFKFDKCDPAQLASTTRCYEIWLTYDALVGALTVNYATASFQKLPRCFRELIDICTFECFPVATNPNFGKEKLAVSSFDEVCFGNYNCVRSVYCCEKDKFDKHCRKYDACCKKHAHGHYHKGHCKKGCSCGYQKKYGDGAAPESDSDSSSSSDSDSDHGKDYGKDHGKEEDHCKGKDYGSDHSKGADHGKDYGSDHSKRSDHGKDYESDHGDDGYDYTCPYKGNKCCYHDNHHGEKRCGKNDCCWGGPHDPKKRLH